MQSSIRLFLAPCCICFLLSAAHFYYAQQQIYVILCVMGFFSVLIRHPICLRLNQCAMLLLTAEWINTLAEIYVIRSAYDQPWLRMAAILGAVALLHFASAMLFQHYRIRRYFGYPRQYLFR
ncbi:MULTISPECIES: hypothetical protein [unclassified Agarivorans]|uniref:hypothetical protein n=1 Tax=unclassified Agarivorans TaxID=2636026 RepID=UPI0026E1ECB3|nr:MULTISPECIES: hypothetical protein [unclassified Agarivorans]MDO6687301.1 hypothetical protein [Agarivorans sp. 3_MG-2023]MDO6716959.1 hypothetical protein [Agarivorans sp. 2_MG-2023]